MKKLLLLLVTLAIMSSCMSEDDTTTQFYMEFAPVESVVMPESFSRGHTYEIKVNYSRPSSCHYFQGFLYEPVGNIRTVAVQTLYFIDGNCQPFTVEEGVSEAKFNFECSPAYTDETYIFKFYKGQNEDGTDDYLVYEVPVVQ